jgi:hypothetical protein
MELFVVKILLTASLLINIVMYLLMRQQDDDIVCLQKYIDESGL